MSKSFSVYLDFVRFFASFLVVIYHGDAIYESGLLIATLGHEAVVVFFVLSGFVIAFVAAEKEHSVGDFLLARAARILSVAIPAIVITAVLDYAGFSINPLAYPLHAQAWDLPALRALISSLFLNEVWFLGVQLYSNAPYWSLSYEVWYYLAFAAAFYAHGSRRWLLLAITLLLMGPKIWILMPIWWLGVWVYRSSAWRSMTDRSAQLLLALSTLGFYFYIDGGIAQWGYESARALIGPEWHARLSFSKQFIGDYFLGLLLAAHLGSLRVLLHAGYEVPRGLRRTVGFFAGATFSLYLFHQPLLWFYYAVFMAVQPALDRYILVMFLTVASALGLSYLTERRKHLWKALIMRCIALAPRTLAVRLRQ